MSKFKIDDKVTATEHVKGTGTITEVSLNPTRSARYHIEFISELKEDSGNRSVIESGWFREEELKASE